MARKEVINTTESEVKFFIECADIKLLNSNLIPLQNKIKEDIDVLISAKVIEFLSISNLNVKITHKNKKRNDTPMKGYQFDLTYSVIFRSSEGTPTNLLGEFTKLYTISILWPYVREYVHDTFSRCGESDFLLPLINPQVFTENLIKSKKINVEVFEGKLEL